MKVSQVVHCMDRGEYIRIIDSNLPCTELLLFEDKKQNLYKDNPLNQRRIVTIWADDDIITVDVAERGQNDKRRNKKGYARVFTRNTYGH